MSSFESLAYCRDLKIRELNLTANTQQKQLALNMTVNSGAKSNLTLESSGLIKLSNHAKTLIAFDKTGALAPSSLLTILEKHQKQIDDINTTSPSGLLDMIQAQQAQIESQQTQINQLITYINNVKAFISAFKDGIYLESEPNSGTEFNYTSLTQ
jgi:hypothetical protein